MVGLGAGVALALAACSSPATLHASPVSTASTTVSTTTVPTSTTAKPANTGPALDAQSVDEIDSELSGLQSLLVETASDLATSQQDN